MPNLLSDIVRSALSNADRTMKLASARDAKPDATDPLAFLDADLGGKTASAVSDEVPGGEIKPKLEEKRASSADVLSDAEYAMKLAESLEIGANIVSAKLASGSVQDAPGPAITRSDTSGKVTVPKASSKVTDRITGSAPAGTAGGLPTTRDDFTSVNDHKAASALPADFATNKEAALRVLHAKTAEAEVMLNAGQAAMATKLLEEIKVAQAKLAQDPSSPQPSSPGHSDSFRLSTAEGTSSHIGDNASLINITKAQAKNSTVRETTQHFSEPPKTDPAIAAHVLRTDGAKISSFDPVAARALLAKTIKMAQDPASTPEERSKAASLLESVKSKLGNKAVEDLLA